jgi:hypothetical protein
MNPSTMPPDTFVETLGRIQKLVTDAIEKISTALNRAERAHNRAALLQAYKRRHSWKKADIPRLLTLDLNDIARRRLERVAGGRGRPVVSPHRPFAEVIEVTLANLQTMFDESTSPTDRLKMLRKTPWWPYFVEALYRDEYESAKAGKIKSASSIAERSVGDTFNVSPELVRKICGEVRRKRKDGTALPDSPAITVTKFEHWKKTGHFDQV